MNNRFPEQYTNSEFKIIDGDIKNHPPGSARPAGLILGKSKITSIDVFKNTTVINLDGESIVIDPSADTVPSYQNKKVSCVLLSHAHFDHVSGLSNIFSTGRSPEIICSLFTQRFLNENQWDTAGINDAIRDAHVLDPMGNNAIDFANGLKLQVFSGGHCFGNLAFHLSDADSGFSLFVGNEATVRTVGGCDLNIPNGLEADVLVVDGHFSNSETNHEPELNHSELHGLLNENISKYKNIRIVTNGSLGIHQDVFMAVKAWQFKEKPEVAKIYLKGLRHSVLDQITTLIADSLGEFPWNGEINFISERDHEPFRDGIIVESTNESIMKRYCENCVENKNEFVICVNTDITSYLVAEENFSCIHISTHASEVEVISLARVLNTKQIIFNCNGNSKMVPIFENKVGISCASAMDKLFRLV